MKKGNRKSTNEEIQLMLKLYEAGLSFSEIGKKLKRDHTSILYQIKKIGIYDPQRKLLSLKQQRNFDSTSLEKEIEKETEEKKKEEESKLDLCIFCKKLKEDLKWKLTNFCSKNCWNLATSENKMSNWEKEIYKRKIEAVDKWPK